MFLKEKLPMRTTTTDPMTFNAVTELENAPIVIEGQGDNAIKIDWESVRNRDDYLDVESHGSGDM